MITQALRVARFRLPSTVARSRGGYLAIVLLIGLIGGIVLTIYLFVALVLPERF